MKAKLLLALLSFFLFISVASKFVYAEGEVSLEDFPQELANKLGTDLFVGQLLASVILLCLVEFPALMLSKGNLIVGLIVGLPTMGVTVAAGWMPIWIFLVTCLLTAILMADKARVWITGRST